jgi:N-acetylmuramoyl-L-alanine amidase CwlD
VDTLNSTNRSRVRTGSHALSAACLAACLAFAALAPARILAAPAAPSFWFAGTTLVLNKAQTRSGEVAVASDDAGLGRFLAKLGASLSYDSAQRLVLITTGDRRVVAFTIGDSRYSAGDVRETAPFAPYLDGGSAYVPFLALAKALYVLPVADGSATVLQPQIGGLDVRVENRVTTVTLRAAAPLKFKRLSSASDERLAIVFNGVGSTLEHNRRIGGSAELNALTIESGGSARNPSTTITFGATRGSLHALGTPASSNEIAIEFAKRGVALAGPPVPDAGEPRPAATPAVALVTARDASPAPSSEYAPVGADMLPVDNAIPPPPLGPPVTVTSLDATASGDALNVRIGVSGPVRYEWHRLGDNRWYIDLRNATLGIPGRDEQPPGSSVSLRVRQLSTGPNPSVRIAFTLPSARQVEVLPVDGGFTVAIAALDEHEPQRVGAGRVAGGKVVAAVPLAGNAGELWSSAAAQAAARPLVPTNPKLIVIDPGHGGSDSGAAQNGLVEKNVALDISKRLRKLLIARGWQVKLTRETDVDVFGPNDSAHDELQARCDIANDAGARLFVSVHANSFPSPALNGTLTYYYKGSDQALANAIHRRLAGSLSTVDKGVRKEEFYVIHHTTMPATLIETAFLSNASDAARLRSPEFLQRLAVAIADGIGDYAASNPVAPPTTDGT